MPPRPYTSDGKGQAVAPPQPDFQPRRALWTEDYVAGGAWASLASYVRSLPLYQDPLSRDFPAVYEQMPLDPVVQASTRTIKLAVLADDITPRPAIDDADDPDYELAAELTDFMTDVYAGLSRPIDDLCYELLDGVFVGHRVAEKVGKIQEGGPHSGFLVWDRVNVKPRHNTAFVLDAYSNLVGLLGLIPGRGLPVLANAVIDSTRGVENLLPREKFLVFSWNMKDNDPRGQPLYRACYEPWWHKQQVLGQWLKFLGQTAVPSLFATTAEGADFLPLTDALGNQTSGTQVSHVQQLLNQLIQLQGGTAMAAPYGTAIQVIQATGDGSAFTRRIEYADNCIARVLTLQTLATIEARHGTRAQAEVHQDSLDLGVAYVRRCLARALTEDLHRPLIRYNWGEDVARRLCPYASLTATAPQDRTKVLPAYAAVGYTLAPEQYAAVDEELGLPVRAAPPELPPPPPGAPPGTPPDQTPGGGNGSDQVASADNPDVPFYDPDQARDESGRWALGAGGVTAVLAEARSHAQVGEKALRRSAAHEKRALSLLKNDDPARGRFWPVRREALAGTGDPLADLSARQQHASRLASDLERFAGEKESSPAPGEAKVPGHARNAAAAAREAAGHLRRADEAARPAREEQARVQAVWQQLDGALEQLDALTYDFPRGGDHAHAADLERLESLADSLVSGGSDLSGQRQTAQALRQEAARLSSALSTMPVPADEHESHRALVQSVRGVALRAGEADRLLSRLESYHAPRDVQLSAPPETPVPEPLPPPVAASPVPAPGLGEGNVYVAFRAYLEEATDTAAKS